MYLLVGDDDVTIFDPGGRSVFWRSFSTGLFGAMVFVLVFLNAEYTFGTTSLVYKLARGAIHGDNTSDLVGLTWCTLVRLLDWTLLFHRCRVWSFLLELSILNSL